MTTRKKAMSATSEAYQEAFNQLDLLTTKIDDLKQKYNESARELMAPVEAVPEVKPDGRYSVTVPLKSERPMEGKPRPPIPRPTPRIPKAPLVPTIDRRPSGRFYIQVPNAASTEELRQIRDKLYPIGRIVDSGTSTASNPSSGWLEIAVRDSDISDLIAKLRDTGLKEVVEKVIQIAPGEGRIQARQLDLPIELKSDK